MRPFLIFLHVFYILFSCLYIFLHIYVGYEDYLSGSLNLRIQIAVLSVLLCVWLHISYTISILTYGAVTKINFQYQSSSEYWENFSTYESGQGLVGKTRVWYSGLISVIYFLTTYMLYTYCYNSSHLYVGMVYPS